MPLVLCHSPKGGAGTSFVAAQLALAFAARGRSVTALGLGAIDGLSLHCGMPPSFRAPPLLAEGAPAPGIDLRHDSAAAARADLPALLARLGLLSDERMLVVDLPSGSAELARLLEPIASVSLCILAPSPDCAAMLPQLAAEAQGLFVVNGLDETRRIYRHCAAFMREVLGERLIGRIRGDIAVDEAQAMLLPLARHAFASEALADVNVLADRVAVLLGGEVADGGASRRAA